MPDLIVTAVAFYGTKTGALRDLATSVQEILRGQLGRQFRPYTLDQIHGTVIRLDGYVDPATGLVVSQRHRGITGAPAMDHSRAQEILAARLTPPLQIRVGGFRPDQPAAFTSRGQHPYERSFTLTRDSWDQHSFVLMGWPEATIATGPSDQPLDELRRELSQAGVPHWYHREPSDVDNDLHLVVGHLAAPPPDGAVPLGNAVAAVQAVRSYLAEHPVPLAVGLSDLTIIASRSSTLAPAEFMGRLPVDPATFAKLYQ